MPGDLRPHLVGIDGPTVEFGTFGVDQQRLNIAKLQHTKPFMPPFAGTAEEVEAIVQYLTWEYADRPAAWSESKAPVVISRIGAWLAEAE